MQAALLFYNKLVSALKSKGFTVNPYDPCVANCEIDGSQMTVVWHVDDMKVSHANPERVTEMINWVQECFAGDNIGKLKITRGKLHEFLGMTFNFNIKGEVKITMNDFITNIVSTFPSSKEQIYDTPAADGLFKIDSTT